MLDRKRETFHREAALMGDKGALDFKVMDSKVVICKLHRMRRPCAVARTVQTVNGVHQTKKQNRMTYQAALVVEDHSVKVPSSSCSHHAGL